MARIIAIVQSRMQSVRLPGKALLPIGDRTLLSHVLTRVSQAKLIDGVIVATGLDPSNDPIETLCRHEGWTDFRGSDDDVLDRFYRAARIHDADAIVRISGDSPLIDPGVIDECVRRLRTQHLDYVTNTMPPTCCDGLDVEVFTFRALALAWLRARLPSEREHCTPWLRAHLPRNVVGNVFHDPDLSAYRLCVDTEDDLAVMREIMDLAGSNCTWRDAVDVLDGHPEIACRNQHLERNSAYVAQVKEEQRA